MSSQHVSSDENVIVKDSIGYNQKSAPCAIANRLSSAHHVRHHSYETATTSNVLATQIFPSRSKPKENTNSISHFPPTSSTRSLHRHTGSCALDSSSLNNLTNYQHHYSASQENLRNIDESSSSSLASIPPRKPTPSCFQSFTSTTTTNSNGGGGGGDGSSTAMIHHHHHSSPSSSSSVLNHFNIHNGKLIALMLFFALLFYHGSLRYIKGATSCHRLLNEGRIERYHVWQPTGCMIHWYDLLDFNQCIRLITQSPATIDGTLLATQKAFNNRIDPGEWLRTRKQEQARARQQQQQQQQQFSTKNMDFRYAFVGDERLYMIYRTFFNTIKYRSNLQRNRRKSQQTSHASIRPLLFKHNRNVTYSNENFQLQYYSMNTFGDSLLNLLLSWSNSTNTRPHVLVLSLGLYNGLKENGSHEAIQYFESNLTRIKQILVTNLSLSTTIFWFGQPHLYVNEHMFRFDDGLTPTQNEFVNEFINRINAYIDRINHITRNQFYHTNIYWHSSTVLEESSSFGSLSTNAFFYDDNKDDYLQPNDDNGDYSSNMNIHDESSITTTTSTGFSSLPIDLEQMQQDDNGNEISFYSYLHMKKNRTLLSTSMMNTGKIHEFYKLSSFTRHTCVQILLNALCNPLLLPDDGTCCAQVPPLTRLQFIISILLGCSITFFIVYIVYRIRSVFLLRRKNTIKSMLPTTNTNDQQRENKISNGHCHMNGAFNHNDDEEAHQQLLTPMGNGHCQFGSQRNKNNHPPNGHLVSMSIPPASLSTGLSRFRFLIPKFLRNLRKKSREHLLPPLLLTTSIATQSSSCSSGNGNNNSNSSYPSRFYKKKNSLLHFPFTEPAVLRTSVKYAFILLYFYLADRTDFLMKENSHFSRIAFFLPLTYIGVLGIFFHDKYVVKSPSSSPVQSSSPNQTPTTSPGSSFGSALNDDCDQQSHSDSSDDTGSRLSTSSSSFSSSSSNNILNKEQINEMRGWMMVILLAYQMTDASGKSLVLSMCIQLLISAYLFLSAYGHFHFYWTTGNYQFLPFLQMLFKYNFLTITLCLIMNRHYQSYYYPPLISFYFTLIYVVLGCLPPRIHAGSVKEKPIHFIYLLFKFLVLGILLTTLSMSAYLFESIFTFRLWTNLFTTSTITSSLAAYVQQLDQSDLSHNGLHQLRTLIVHVNSLTNGEQNSLLDYISGSGQGIVGPVSMNGISLGDSKLFYSNLHRHNSNSSSSSNTHLDYDRNGTINDWYHRWNLDRYTVLYGMIFAYVVLFLQNYDTYKTLGIKRKQCQQMFHRFVSILCALSLFGLGAYFVVLFLCSNKAICDEIHPYIVVIPIVSYILLRNMPAFLRRQYSPFFAWFGRISLELFVTQYHIWLVANGHGTLTIIPRMPTLNLLLTTFLFVCCCHELHRITNILTPVFVPNDCKCFIRNCLVYILVIVASSYMFSSI